MSKASLLESRQEKSEQACLTEIALAHPAFKIPGASKRHMSYSVAI